MVNRAFLVAGLAAGVLAAAGCDRMQLLAPTNSTVTVHAAALVLSAGGTTEVTATVLESAGTPVQNGTMVRFTTTLGRVDPVEVQTRNGLATTTFYAGEASGVADIRATSGAAGAGGTSGSTGTGTGTGTGSGTGSTSTTSSVVQVSVGAAAVDSITVQANPSFVSFNGGTVDVVATVLGTGGRTLAGIPVTFTTTAGTLNPISAITDANGQAHSKLTTNTAATVRASAAGKTSTGDGAAITVTPSPGVTLTCAIGTATNCFSALVGQPVAFTAARASTTSTIRSARLEFGDGTGSVDLGNLAASTTVPHIYNQPGDYNARLIVTDINNETIVVSAFVHVVLPATAVVTAEVTEGRTVRATATVTGGTVLTYEWTFEGTTPQMVTSTNEVTFTYTSGSLTAPKVILVKATLADGRTVSASTSLFVMP